MPKAVQYKRGSYIYFAGDNANNVFVLQQGSVTIITTDPQMNVPIKELVMPGEFFGVKQALGNYKRDESAMAVQDSTILTFETPEFEAFLSGNTGIAFKMLKVFSNQLRTANSQLNSMLNEKKEDVDAGLFNVGCYFFNQRLTDKAKYVFERYVEEYPQGKNIDLAKKYLAKL
ncbi:hypothetical protein AGMMS50212_01620 [Spirochaetia bacterium]|nr:hypothetical protein AGMMS50212_01620 [Spirochaetia bacterium]